MELGDQPVVKVSRTDKRFAGKIVLIPNVTMLCNLLFYCGHGRAWPIRKSK